MAPEERARRRLAVVLAIAVVMATSAAGTTADREQSRAMVDTINEARARHGVPPLRHHPALSRSARRYARHLLHIGTFGHADRIRASHRFRRLGELLSWHRGRKPRPGRTVRRWLRSGAHRPVLLGRAFRFAGAGRVSGSFRGQRCTIWVVHLGAR